MNKSVKTLLLIRHAHRDTSDRDVDNGLSEKGEKQARRLLEHIEENYLEAATESGAVVLSSPKKRCVETVSGIARLLGVKVKVDPLLVEQEPEEANADLVRRILLFIAWWKKDAPALVVASSHGDWLPLAADKLVGQEISFRKGQGVEFQISPDGKVKAVAQFND